jgi:hypothetical protein
MPLRVVTPLAIMSRTTARALSLPARPGLIEPRAPLLLSVLRRGAAEPLAPWCAR